MKSHTKFEALCAVYEQFSVKLLACGFDKAIMLAQGFQISIKKLQEENPKPQSKVVQGLEQGLTELPLIIWGFPKQLAQRLLKDLLAITEAEYPLFVEQQRKHLNRVLARGAIYNEQEYHLVDAMLSVLERDEASASQCLQLQKLLDGFQSSADGT